MQPGGDRPRLGYRGSVSSRAKDFAVKALAVVAGGVMVASAFVLSLAFFAIALAVVLIFGGYIWWKTRNLRRQVREELHAQMRQSQPQDDVIEGVVISRRESRDDVSRPR